MVERERRGVFLELAPDAMARLIAYLPAAEATAAFTAIDALAGHAAVDGDTRTVDQRRADAFADVFTSILDRQATPDGTPLPTRHGQRVALQVIRRGHHPARPGRPTRAPRVLRSDPRAGRPRARPGRHLAARADRPGHRAGLLRRHRRLPAGRGPDPHRRKPATSPARSPAAGSPRPGARSTTASRTTSRARPEGTGGTIRRPARRTSTRCASTTTRPRPRAGGPSPTTRPPGSPLDRPARHHLRPPSRPGPGPTRRARPPSTSPPPSATRPSEACVAHPPASRAAHPAPPFAARVASSTRAAPRRSGTEARIATILPVREHGRAWVCAHAPGVRNTERRAARQPLPWRACASPSSPTCTAT